MIPGNSIAPLASTLACKKRRLDKSAMTTPEKKPKKSAHDAEAPVDAFIPKTHAPPLAHRQKWLIR
ncbi:hypothetical protein EKN30_07615 [Enterobacter asburiae]|jgi:hypothetical protein|nr:hypothetical protein [Enterobacter asburiae]QBB05400.1 hypothetical protein EVV94_10645 [Enterobacter cloacae]KZR42778.1 hypothetical protein A3N68_12335 [Enterobacter asburiae]OAY21123.1 hypothetical protein AXY04_06155 [Enterobacter asburiae]OZP68682.1 hypothetical protein CIG53_08095 [Enterobacter asburiae]